MESFSDIASYSNLISPVGSSARSMSTRSTSYSHSINLREGENCPVCRTVLRYYYISLDETLLMCGNEDCDYPFHEDILPIFKNDELSSMSKYSKSKRTSDDTSATCSVTSTSWSELERNARALDSDYTLSEYRPKSYNKISTEKLKLLQHKDVCKNLSNELKRTNKIGLKRMLTNDRIIKKLRRLEEISGGKILEEEELQKIKDSTNRNMPQLKVNVNTNVENSVSCINIELVDMRNEENGTEDIIVI